MAITFTRKAGAEMKERLNDLLGPAVCKELTIGTYHSICGSILRRCFLTGYGVEPSKRMTETMLSIVPHVRQGHPSAAAACVRGLPSQSQLPDSGCLHADGATLNRRISCFVSILSTQVDQETARCTRVHGCVHNCHGPRHSHSPDTDSDVQAVPGTRLQEG